MQHTLFIKVEDKIDGRANALGNLNFEVKISENTGQGNAKPNINLTMQDIELYINNFAFNFLPKTRLPIFI